MPSQSACPVAPASRERSGGLVRSVLQPALKAVAPRPVLAHFDAEKVRAPQGFRLDRAGPVRDVHRPTTPLEHPQDDLYFALPCFKSRLSVAPRPLRFAFALYREADAIKMITFRKPTNPRFRAKRCIFTALPDFGEIIPVAGAIYIVVTTRLSLYLFPGSNWRIGLKFWWVSRSPALLFCGNDSRSRHRLHAKNNAICFSAVCGGWMQPACFGRIFANGEMDFDWHTDVEQSLQCPGHTPDGEAVGYSRGVMWKKP